MSNATVLVVDDIAANLEVVSQVLEDAGYEVATAIDGERALKLVNIHPPDLILLDIQMPGIDGFETCRRLKASPTTAAIPIIFITALTDVDSTIKGFDYGAVDYITKPFQASEMLARVKTHLQLHHLTRTLETRVAERTQDLQVTLDQLHQSQLQLVQSEKMSALGNLVAGVAHEVNNPISFLNGSIKNAQDYANDLLQHLILYQEQYPDAPEIIQQNAQDIELEFLQADFLKMLQSMRGATDRIKSLSAGLRNFSRADKAEKVFASLHEALDSTLMILKYRLNANKHRPAITVVKNYGNLDPVECFPNQINQVLMNILANAIDAFDEVAEQALSVPFPAASQQITITTTVLTEENLVEIRLRDNGNGMEPVVQAKIFDYLFTTKAIGKGTGLGLTIAYRIVTEAHGGSLTVESAIGEGTEFCIRLPM
ncbi:response regulator [filamentous cyanobacterium LEGE 11480]|uniref:histidine kinase n=1 Tax=Romeriopsis navalis LEGE 11480 TaxID=2777977 RepID=A0A928VLJ3_9CYAN|nr:response regulator [Romeriopsis navalis]MBE9029948.1 response regulator [Romeriopsis navalis LEGE 11480]